MRHEEGEIDVAMLFEMLHTGGELTGVRVLNTSLSQWVAKRREGIGVVKPPCGGRWQANA